MIVLISYIFFFISTATTEIYTLSLHDALPISVPAVRRSRSSRQPSLCRQLVETRQQALPLRLRQRRPRLAIRNVRSEEHTSELQSRRELVCRLLLEKKKSSLYLHPILVHHSIH